jgi:hypothetical protein
VFGFNDVPGFFHIGARIIKDARFCRRLLAQSNRYRTISSSCTQFASRKRFIESGESELSFKSCFVHMFPVSFWTVGLIAEEPYTVGGLLVYFYYYYD